MSEYLQNICKAHYEYDAWGNVLSITDQNGNAITSSTHIGNLNPFRYRGYYYDTESGFYYLMSRYYDPVTHRFINADGYFQSSGDVLDANTFAYCGNNPIIRADPSGQVWGIVIGVVLVVGLIVGLSGCSKPNSSSANSKSTSAPATSSKPKPTPSPTEEQKVLIATIAAEATVTAQGNPVSSAGRQAMANVALNRVGSREWSEYTTVVEICQFTGFDGYGNSDYKACMDYLNARDGSNAMYEAIIWDVMAAYDNDITGGCQLYYTPAAMTPAGSSPQWNFDILTEVNIPGVDPYYEGRFFKY